MWQQVQPSTSQQKAFVITEKEGDSELVSEDPAPLVGTMEDVPEDMRDQVQWVRDLFEPLNMPVRYGGPRLDMDSKTYSNEYEWGPEPFSEASTEEDNEQTLGEEQVAILHKLQVEMEHMRLERQKSYEQVKKTSEQNTYGSSLAELEATWSNPTISPEEAKWERRKNLINSTNLCE